MESTHMNAIIWSLLRSGFKIDDIAQAFGVTHEEVILAADNWGTALQKIVFEKMKGKK